MKVFLLLCILFQFYLGTSTKIKPELKKNILKFGYGINYKYEDLLTHSFDRFYIVTRFMLPLLGNFKFSNLNYDNTCAYLENKNSEGTRTRKYMLDLKTIDHWTTCIFL